MFDLASLSKDVQRELLIRFTILVFVAKRAAMSFSRWRL
jgi:hypothetical protein